MLAIIRFFKIDPSHKFGGLGFFFKQKVKREYDHALRDFASMPAPKRTNSVRPFFNRPVQFVYVFDAAMPLRRTMAGL
jgi:hypothetical protein